MSMKIYNFDSSGCLVNESIAKTDPRESERQGKDVYLLPKNATFIEPIEYNPELEYLKFDKENQKWIMKDITLNGNYYLQTNGNFIDIILKKDIDLYTINEPNLPIYCDNDKIEFNQEKQIWEYVNCTNERLSATKENKIKEIKQEASKRILSNYPQYKQNNIISDIMQIQNKELMAFKQNLVYKLSEEDLNNLKKSKECKDYIFLIRQKSNVLEELIQSKESINTIEAINVTEDNYWI